MEMVAREEEEEEQLSWKEGWPQPGEGENGNGGVEVKGGQLKDLVMGEQECGGGEVEVAKSG